MQIYSIKKKNCNGELFTSIYKWLVSDNVLESHKQVVNSTKLQIQREEKFIYIYIIETYEKNYHIYKTLMKIQAYDEKGYSITHIIKIKALAHAWFNNTED